MDNPTFYDESSEEEDSSGLAESLQSLPLIEDDPYLRMQAFNLEVVSKILDDMESSLLREYLETDGTPSSVIIVSAVSQLWVFGIYELLRTWRQRAFDVLKFGHRVAKVDQTVIEKAISEKVEQLNAASADPEFGSPWVVQAYELAGRDPEFHKRVQLALDRSERAFRKLEALRVHLAKHEVPKSKGVYGMAPGYGRIDESTGSIFWQVPLGNMEVDMISRHSLRDLCKRFPVDESIALLPYELRSKIAKFAKVGYGVKFVTLILDDGSMFDAYIAWDCQILKVVDCELIEFDPTRIRDISEAELKDI